MTTALKLGIVTGIGGYYGVEALTNHSIPVVVRNTIEKKLKEAGYKIFQLKDEEWQAKFEQLRGKHKLTTLAKILQETKENEFVVTKEAENKDGGQALKDWFIEVLDLEVEKATANKLYRECQIFLCRIKDNKTSISCANSSRTWKCRVNKS